MSIRYVSCLRWAAVKRVLRYIKGPDFNHSSENAQVIFCNDQRAPSLTLNESAGCPGEQRPTSGFAIFLVQILYHGAHDASSPHYPDQAQKHAIH